MESKNSSNGRFKPPVIGVSSRTAFSEAGCRFVDAHWTDRHVAASGGVSDSWRKLLPGRYCCRPRRKRAERSEDGIRLKIAKIGNCHNFKRAEQVFSSWVIEGWANIYPLIKLLIS